jgi:signal transduction histidine kinase
MTLDAPAITAQLDCEDRLVSADDTFLALNTRAGGRVGATLATPQLATIARLARRLAIPVTRPVTIADAEADIDCWVRARPGADGVVLTLAEIRERTPGARRMASGPVSPPPGAHWIWEADAGLRLRRIDPEAAARHGIDPAAALAQPLTRTFTLEADEDGAMPLLEAIGDRSDFDRQRARLPDGTRVRLAANALRDATGAVLGLIGGVMPDDVEAGPGDEVVGFHVRLEEALRRPLDRIVAEADAMNAEVDGPLAAHYVDYAADIASAGRHLLALVDDLADLNAIERPDFHVEADEIDLADLARRAAGLLSVRAADSGVVIERPTSDEHLPAIGEFRRTLQILVNLVTNAVRYSPQGAAVTVSIAREGDRAIVQVADRGKGIAAADQSRIFDKFERADPTEPGGSGLGLYIARRLARAMNGDLTVESAPGQGARFTLTLPAR